MVLPVPVTVAPEAPSRAVAARRLAQRYRGTRGLSFVLSGFAMWLLVRHLTGSYVAGLVAGMVFAFSPWHYGQYGHLGLAAQFWMVFALYFLVRFLEESEPPARPANRRSLLFLGLFLLLFATAGTAALFAKSPFERRLRDIHMVAQQIQGRKSHYQAVGAWMFGHPPDLSIV